MTAPGAVRRGWRRTPGGILVSVRPRPANQPDEHYDGACGDYRGAVRHRRLGEEPCDACREGERDYRRRVRRAAKERAAERAAKESKST